MESNNKSNDNRKSKDPGKEKHLTDGTCSYKTPFSPLRNRCSKQWQAWLARNISVFVAEVEDAIVGFAGDGAIREPFAPYDAELYTIYLLKEQQGCGIGKRLLNALTEDLLAKKYSSMLVWVLEQNAAVHFYENTGAQFLMSKQIEIGGAQLPELALGWPNLRSALSVSSSAAER